MRGPGAGWLILALLALAGCTQSGPCRLELATTLPLQLSRDGHFLVPATVNAQAITLIVDTGSARTLINPRRIRGVAFDQASAIVHGIGGDRLAGIGRVTLALGTLRGSVPVVGVAFQHADGILGIDILGAYDVDFDWPGQQLRLFKPQGACPGGAVFLQGAIYQEKLIPAVDNRPTLSLQVGGISLFGILDTGAPGLMLSRAAATRLGLTAASLTADRQILARGLGPGTARAHIHRLAAITFGPITVRNIPAVISDQPLPGDTEFLLGTDIARRIHLWLANTSGQLYLQYPPLPSPALPPGRHPAQPPP